MIKEFVREFCWVLAVIGETGIALGLTLVLARLLIALGEVLF